MTELKPTMALDANKPVEKVVEPVKAPAVEAPPARDKNTATPIEVVKAGDKIAPAV